MGRKPAKWSINAGFSVLLAKQSPTRRNRKCYWHMSKTIASGVRLTNAWLAEQGLLSLKTLREKLAPLR